MANVTSTAADIRPLEGAVVRRFDAGGAITVGYAVYLAGDGDVEVADGSAVGTTKPALGVLVGVAPEAASSTAAAAGDAVDVVMSGPVAGFSSLTPGTLLYVSDDAGRIADAVGTKDCELGIALSADTIFVRVRPIDLA